MSILDKLVAKNQLPVIFLGSGISKRFVKNYPTWQILLLHLWLKTGFQEEEFYNKMLEIRDGFVESLKSKGVEKIIDADVDFETNTKIASFIETEFNRMFSQGKIMVNNFSAKESLTQNISAFKKEIANYLSDLELIPECMAEIEEFRKLILKSRTIFTTNYDKLIERLVDDEFKVYSHQTDLFMSHIEYGELFKLHGCVSDPREIVITESDYSHFDRNCVLISAKLISFLIDSPIIFLGYSLTDTNISRIFRSFTDSLTSTQRATLQERIIYVNYDPSSNELHEYIKESESLNSQLTVIETNDFKSIFAQLSQIDQGVPVSYIRQFSSHIKKLIVERGTKKSLKTLLISPTDLANGEIDDDKLVIAIGDNTVIFNFPNRFDYIQDYFKDSPEIPTDIALRYIASQQGTTRIPIFKHLNDVKLDESRLRSDEIEKIKQRIQRYRKIDKIRDSIANSYRKHFDSINEILTRKERLHTELDFIAFNISRFDLCDVEKYIKDKLKSITYMEFRNDSTSFCRLIVEWDILKHS